MELVRRRVVRHQLLALELNGRAVSVHDDIGTALTGAWYGDSSENYMCDCTVRPARKARARWRFVHKTFLDFGLCDCRGKWQKRGAAGPQHMACTVCEKKTC